MGRIFYPLRKKGRKPISRNYLGLGYWLVSYDDGTEELQFFWDMKRPFISDATEFTQDGFPIWEGR